MLDFWLASGIHMHGYKKAGSMDTCQFLTTSFSRAFRASDYIQKQKCLHVSQGRLILNFTDSSSLFFYFFFQTVIWETLAFKTNAVNSKACTKMIAGSTYFSVRFSYHHHFMIVHTYHFFLFTCQEGKHTKGQYIKIQKIKIKN